jgi:hypothetical protein
MGPGRTGQEMSARKLLQRVLLHDQKKRLRIWELGVFFPGERCLDCDDSRTSLDHKRTSPVKHSRKGNHVQFHKPLPITITQLWSTVNSQYKPSISKDSVFPAKNILTATQVTKKKDSLTEKLDEGYKQKTH